MFIVDETSAEDYLRGAGRLAPGEHVQVRELPGGVSNMVLLVEPADRPGERFVLKQARAQLRTTVEWHSDVRRIWREAEVLEVCTRLLSRPTGVQNAAPQTLTACTPRILFEDRENYLLAMAAAPEPNTVWKQQLLAGRIDPRIAAACGHLLGTLHAASWLDDPIARRLGDRALFDQLRIDPYYRTLARVHAEIAPAISALVASLATHVRSLVHADFSPKNLLVFDGGLMMVDFETGHYGDPAFDLGFFLSHLVLKACLKIPDHAAYLALCESFRASYDDVVGREIGPDELAELWSRGVRHFAACTWARLDGKSPVEYLTDPGRRDLLRALCRELLTGDVAGWPAALALCNERFAQAGGDSTRGADRLPRGVTR